ncbi:MAG: SpoIIE family protein phosphatase [Candidatus Eremiobacteraeota bacterium]|nr:SpoIIE family protein phosphatase [Candidatus Eremiobacteraeota bacterium]
MSNFPFRIDTGFLSASFSRSQRVLIVAGTAIAALLLAYVDYRMPHIFLAPLATLGVLVIQAVAGLSGGVAAAISLAVLFTVAERLAVGLPLNGAGIIAVLPALVTYLLVALLLEFIRRQSATLSESELKLQSFELMQTKSELAEAESRYQAVGEALPFGIWHCGPDGHLTHMSDSFLKLVGMTLEQTVKGGWFARVVPEDADRIRAAWQGREAWGEVWEDEYRIIGADSKMYTLLCRGRRIVDDKGQLLGWTGINLDITERARAREQLSFLAEAGRVLSLSLDPATTLERIARLAVPRIADWCGVDILQEDGEIRSLAVLHADASKTDIARELRAYPQDDDETRGLRKVLKTGQSELYEEIPYELLVLAARDERQLYLLRQLGMKSVMIVPLIARDRILGAISFITAESGRRYGKDDLAFTEILSRRAALAYDNARMYAREQRVADTLQRASLPTSLPQLPGIRLRATYMPGASESEIGGDWYDAFQLPDGKLAVSIGDVAGKGLRAAVSMASARQAMRAAALEGEPPAGVLDRTNRLLLHENTGMVTAMFGILDPVSLTFDFSSAGHPPAMHGRPDQPLEKVASKGLPLGLFVDTRYVQQQVTLQQGSLLAFYTDGLVEFDRDVVSGEKLLAEAVQAEANGETPDPAVAIVRRLIFGVPKDDIAVLTVAISAQPLEAVDVTVEARPASARVLRQSLRRLALSIGLDESRTFDLLVAAGEAISNAIEHAYGIKDGSVRVRAAKEHDQLIVEVGDQGSWRPPQNNGRGRGLKLMRTLMQKVDIKSNEHGTTVRLAMPLSEYAYDRPGDVPASRA